MIAAGERNTELLHAPLEAKAVGEGGEPWSRACGEEEGDARNNGLRLLLPDRESVTRAHGKEESDDSNDGPRAREVSAMRVHGEEEHDNGKDRSHLPRPERSMKGKMRKRRGRRRTRLTRMEPGPGVANRTAQRRWATVLLRVIKSRWRVDRTGQNAERNCMTVLSQNLKIWYMIW